MSIKPVDFQMAIPRTMEVSKISSDESQRNFAAQQQQAAAMQNKVDSTLTQVYSRSKPQNAKIEEKQKERGGGERKKKGKQGEKEDGASDKSPGTSTIDIKI